MADDQDLAETTRFERREAFASGVSARTGINEAMIERLVHNFYARVRADTVLRPIFAERTPIGSRIWSACVRSGRP